MADIGMPVAVDEMLAGARRVLVAEQRALALLNDGLDESVIRAAVCVAACSGRILVSGLGKSAIAARKMASTLCSLDVPAQFLHAADALHGDLGAVRRDDVLIAISISGVTRELLLLVQHAQHLGTTTIAITSTSCAPLGRACDHVLLLPQCEEGGGQIAAPMASTVASIAMGDVLAVLVAGFQGNRRGQMASLHPGGDLGRKLRPLSQLMHGGDRVPLVGVSATAAELVAEITAKGFGIVGVTNGEGRLVGTVSDGDIRRHFDSLDNCSAGEIMMTHPVALPPDGDIGEALDLMRTHRISALFVTDAATGGVAGLVHIQDLLRIGVI